MKLIDIKKSWQKDSNIENPNNLDVDALAIAKLHSKYLNIYIDTKRKMKLHEMDYARLRKIKREYYLGRMSRKATDKLGWEPMEYENKAYDVSDYLKGDKDLQQIEKLIAMQELKLEFLKQVLKMIHNRGHHIRDAINWFKVKQGLS